MIVDAEYACFIDLLRYTQPSQAQLGEFQKEILLCEAEELQDWEIADSFSSNPDTAIMTVSRAVAQRVNTIVVNKLFTGQNPLCDVPCTAVANGPDILPIVVCELSSRRTGTRLVELSTAKMPLSCQTAETPC